MAHGMFHDTSEDLTVATKVQRQGPSCVGANGLGQRHHQGGAQPTQDRWGLASEIRVTDQSLDMKANQDTDLDHGRPLLPGTQLAPEYKMGGACGGNQGSKYKGQEAARAGHKQSHQPGDETMKMGHVGSPSYRCLNEEGEVFNLLPGQAQRSGLNLQEAKVLGKKRL